MKVKLGKLPADTPSLLPRSQLPLNKYRNNSAWRITAIKRKRGEITDELAEDYTTKKVNVEPEELSEEERAKLTVNFRYFYIIHCTYLCLLIIYC
jgi:hypothetical protein